MASITMEAAPGTLGRPRAKAGVGLTTLALSLSWTEKQSRDLPSDSFLCPCVCVFVLFLLFEVCLAALSCRIRPHLKWLMCLWKTKLDSVQNHVNLLVWAYCTH